MSSKPGFGFWLKTLITRPRVLISLIASGFASSMLVELVSDIMPQFLHLFPDLPYEPILALLIVLVAAVWEISSDSFRAALQKNWRKAQVDGVRNELKAKEKEIMAVRGRPTFQRDRLRRMQAAQKEFLDELNRMDLSGENQVQQDLVEQGIKAFSRYYELLQKEQRVASLLESTNRTEIEKDIERLEKLADSTSREARDQYMRAAEFRKQELRSLERAEQLSSLLQAHMDALESALATMRTRIINTSVWDSTGVGNAYSDLTQELLALEKAFVEVAELEKDPIFEMERLE